VCAAAADFSHRKHLALKLDCAKCHAAAASSAQASDNLLPDRRVCLECHAEAVVPGAPRATAVAHFNHALHAKFGDIAPVLAAAIRAKQYLSPPGDAERHLATGQPCQACHRGLAESDKTSAAHFPRMADCLTCHNKIDPPASCGKCHAASLALKPANHTADFLDAHTSGKLAVDKTSCAVCHGRRFTCLGCH
jgi:hypothetical protein